jgi:hypothetical protein
MRGVLLSGVVADPSGAAIAGATALVRQTDEAFEKRALSDQNGGFSISGLPEGRYRVVTSSPGFETKAVSFVLNSAHMAAPLRVTLAVASASSWEQSPPQEDLLIPFLGTKVLIRDALE